MNNSSDLSATSYKTHSEYKAAEQIWIYMSPVLLFIGTVANTLSIIVLLRKQMRSTTTMFYLTVLSFGDMMVLYTGLLRHWIKWAFHADIRVISQFSCKTHTFLVYFSLDFTTWVLVAVTVDRCIFVCLPFRAKTICTLKHAKIVVVCIALVMTALNIHLFWSVAVEMELGELGCAYMNDFTKFTWPWIDSCVFSIIPFNLMIIANIILIKHILMSQTRVAAHTQHGESDVQQSNVHSKHRKVTSVTTMLLTTNCMFLALTLPIAIYLIVYPNKIQDATDHGTAVLELIWAIANMLQYTNNTIHFFLYCLTGPRFRQEILKIFKLKAMST
ncbi:nociceptin receptor-like [Saccostrea echinata]|uniref:nociceptin receptor-like n=1 Tax=Saccostrea echinata TaxID=191078 RepID=UPI002A81E2AF|nr:nociceptin receptor-like [Saccostrea echinata]XP_061179617.1 nociceptin receptor-like [Saccostrea echinata]